MPFQVDSGGTLDTNLLAYYKLQSDGEDSHDTKDLVEIGTPSHTAGKIGNGVDLNGSSQYLRANNTGHFSFERTDAFSFSLWIKPDNITSDRYIYSKAVSIGSGFSRGYAVRIVNNGKIQVFIYNTDNGTNGIFVETANSAVATGSFQHVVITYDGSSSASGVKVYVNNVSKSLTTFWNSLSATIVAGANWHLGLESVNANRHFDGMIDEVGVWGRELSTTEISDLYNNGDGDPYIAEFARSASVTVANAASRLATVSFLLFAVFIRAISASVANAASRFATVSWLRVFARAAAVNVANAASRFALVASSMAHLFVRTVSVSMGNAASRLATVGRSFIIKISNRIRWGFWTWS